MLKQAAFFSAFFIFLVAVFVLGERAFSPVFQCCIEQNKNADTNTTAKENPAAFSTIASSYIRCSGEFIGGNNGGITALATLIIAAFTGTLWYSTSKQARLTRESIDLARDEFIASHRPKITIRAVKLHIEGAAVGGTYPIEFIYVNEGGNKACIKKIGSAVINSPNCWNYGARKVRFTIESSTEILQSGEERIHPIPDRFDWNLKATNWFCVGYIEYTDCRNVRKTGFCRRWNPERQSWDREENEEYEYSF